MGDNDVWHIDRWVQRFETLPQYQNKVSPKYNPFNLEVAAPKESDFNNDRIALEEEPAIFSTRGGRYLKRPAPDGVDLSMATSMVPIGEPSDLVQSLAARFREDFRLDCMAVMDRSWTRVPYYFDDLDICRWGADFLQRVLSCINQDNNAIQGRLLSLAVHLVATDSKRAKELAYFGKISWIFEEVDEYGADFLNDLARFITHDPSMYGKLEQLAKKYLEESTGDSAGPYQWYNEKFGQLTQARWAPYPGFASSSLLNQNINPPLAPIYRASQQGREEDVLLHAEVVLRGPEFSPASINKTCHMRRTSSMGLQVLPASSRDINFAQIYDDSATREFIKSATTDTKTAGNSDHQKSATEANTEVAITVPTAKEAVENLKAAQKGDLDVKDATSTVIPPVELPRRHQPSVIAKQVQKNNQHNGRVDNSNAVKFGNQKSSKKPQKQRGVSYQQSEAFHGKADQRTISESQDARNRAQTAGPALVSQHEGYKKPAYFNSRSIQGSTLNPVVTIPTVSHQQYSPINDTGYVRGKKSNQASRNKHALKVDTHISSAKVYFAPVKPKAAAVGVELRANESTRAIDVLKDSSIVSVIKNDSGIPPLQQWQGMAVPPPFPAARRYNEFSGQIVDGSGQIILQQDKNMSTYFAPQFGFSTNGTEGRFIPEIRGQPEYHNFNPAAGVFHPQKDDHQRSWSGDYGQRGRSHGRRGSNNYDSHYVEGRSSIRGSNQWRPHGSASRHSSLGNHDSSAVNARNMNYSHNHVQSSEQYSQQTVHPPSYSIVFGAASEKEADAVSYHEPQSSMVADNNTTLASISEDVVSEGETAASNNLFNYPQVYARAGNTSATEQNLQDEVSNPVQTSHKITAVMMEQSTEAAKPPENKKAAPEATVADYGGDGLAPAVNAEPATQPDISTSWAAIVDEDDATHKKSVANQSITPEIQVTSPTGSKLPAFITVDQSPPNQPKNAAATVSVISDTQVAHDIVEGPKEPTVAKVLLGNQSKSPWVSKASIDASSRIAQVDATAPSLHNNTVRHNIDMRKASAGQRSTPESSNNTSPDKSTHHRSHVNPIHGGSEVIDTKKLYVAGINLTNEALIKIFEPYRPITIGSTRLCKINANSGKAALPDGMRFSFVAFESQAACETARAGLNGKKHEGTYLKVNTAYDTVGRERGVDEKLNLSLPWASRSSGQCGTQSNDSVRASKRVTPSLVNDPGSVQSFWGHIQKSSNAAKGNLSPQSSTETKTKDLNTETLTTTNPYSILAGLPTDGANKLKLNNDIPKPVKSSSQPTEELVVTKSSGIVSPGGNTTFLADKPLPLTRTKTNKGRISKHFRSKSKAEEVNKMEDVPPIVNTGRSGSYSFKQQALAQTVTHTRPSVLDLEPTSPTTEGSRSSDVSPFKRKRLSELLKSATYMMKRKATSNTDQPKKVDDQTAAVSKRRPDNSSESGQQTQSSFPGDKSPTQQAEKKKKSKTKAKRKKKASKELSGDGVEVEHQPLSMMDIELASLHTDVANKEGNSDVDSTADTIVGSPAYSMAGDIVTDIKHELISEDVNHIHPKKLSYASVVDAIGFDAGYLAQKGGQASIRTILEKRKLLSQPSNEATSSLCWEDLLMGEEDNELLVAPNWGFSTEGLAADLSTMLTTVKESNQFGASTPVDSGSVLPANLGQSQAGQFPPLPKASTSRTINTNMEKLNESSLAPTETKHAVWGKSMPVKPSGPI